MMMHAGIFPLHSILANELRKTVPESFVKISEICGQLLLTQKRKLQNSCFALFTIFVVSTSVPSALKNFELFVAHQTETLNKV